MPQRFLRPGITTSERWNSVSWEAQSLFIRILTMVDDFGRYDARIPILHGQCFALRNDIKPQRTAALRCELQRAQLIVVYEIDGREYLEITQWQERARSTISKFPSPQDSAADGSGPQRMAADCTQKTGEKSQVVDISTSAAECQQSAADGRIPQDSAASLAIDHRSSTIVPRPSTIAISSETKTEGFDEFWMTYPKKAGKGDAEAAWIKKGCSKLLPQILTAIRKCKISADWTKDAGQFIPHPATWLNRRGWDDELLPGSNGSTLHTQASKYGF